MKITDDLEESNIRSGSEFDQRLEITNPDISGI